MTRLHTVVIVEEGFATDDDPADAESIYRGSFFDLKAEYAEDVGDEWYVLTSTEGLVSPGDELDPYEPDLEDVEAEEFTGQLADELTGILDEITKEVALIVIGDEACIDLVADAGADHEAVYTTYYPFRSKSHLNGIGDQLTWLKEMINTDPISGT